MQAKTRFCQFESASRGHPSSPSRRRGSKAHNARWSICWPQGCAKPSLQKVFGNYFLALTLYPVRENKKPNALLFCRHAVWSTSRVVACKLRSTSRLVVIALRLFSFPEWCSPAPCAPQARALPPRTEARRTKSTACQTRSTSRSQVCHELPRKDSTFVP